MTGFRALFATNLLILALAAWQGVMTATSSLIMTTPQGEATVIQQDHWLVAGPVLAFALFVAVALYGAMRLQARGRTGLATLVLLVPAVPIVLGGLLMIGLMVLFTIGTPHP